MLLLMYMLTLYTIINCIKSMLMLMLMLTLYTDNNLTFYELFQVNVNVNVNIIY